ncbi:hypothetical protein MVEN_01473800 [Mycena venus]|uniref:F-box domain-containing protein n=1 Tax=Mycena venus TaxID=2733690 RepID=A0A8H6XSC9_9AGAR|nr:hypothetical protein MVEN_01473800 [Mycena venus]
MLLPQELIELVLAALDVESLHACSLVSLVFLAPSQALIFRSLVIHYADIPKAQSLFATAPHLLRYVRDLEIELQVTLSEQNPVLASILSSFHHLECLTISGGGVEWDYEVTLPLQSAVHDLLASPDLHTLNLSDIRNMSCSFIFLALSSVKRFALHSISVQEQDGEPHRPASLRIEQFILRAPPSNELEHIVDLILPDSRRRPPGYLDNLSLLSLGMHQRIGVRNPSLRLLVATARTLRHLQLRCGVFQMALDLPLFSVLKVIELRFYLGRGAGFPTNLRTAVAAFLTTTPTLEVLRLTIHGVGFDREHAGNDHSGPFPLFDDACAYRERLLYLWRVHCHWWSTKLCSVQDRADFSVYIHGKFPGLWGTGILQISAGRDQDDRFD